MTLKSDKRNALDQWRDNDDALVPIVTPFTNSITSLGDQHLEKIYRQEESAGARKRQWQPTVYAGETCCPLFHEGPEDLSAKCKC